MALRKISELTLKEIAKICDHTFLMPPEAYKSVGTNAVELRREAFHNFMKKSIEVNPYAVCVRSEDVATTKKILEKAKRTDIKIAATIGFPDGSWHSQKYKQCQTEAALSDGAQQIDMVLNYFDPMIRFDIQAVHRLTKQSSNKAILKVILETSHITQEETLKQYIKVCEEIGVQFIKTSTGFTSKGADVKNVKIMRKIFSKGVKISGGVKPENVFDFLQAASDKDGYINLDPMRIRIGESSLLT